MKAGASSTSGAAGSKRVILVSFRIRAVAGAVELFFFVELFGEVRDKRDETVDVRFVPHARRSGDATIGRCGKGRQATAVAAKAFIEEAKPVPMPLLVGVANLDLLTEQEYTEALQTRLSQIDGRLAAVEAAEQFQDTMPYAASEVFSYSLLLLRTERAWIAERVEEQHG